MEQKHVGFFERHVEKFVFGVCALIALLIVMTYAIGEPYHVRLESGEGERVLEPGEVEPFVAKQADRLESEIERRKSPLPDLSVPTYTENFKKRFNQRVVGVSRFSVPPGLPGISEKHIGSSDEGQDSRYAVPARPRPDGLAIRTGYGALAAPDGEAARRWYEARFGANRPWDVRYVTVGARFDMGVWKKRLRDPAASQGAPIPEQWWGGLLAISELRLERRKWDGESGTWSEPTVIPVAPNVPSFRDLDQPSPAEAEEAVVSVTRRQAAIVQPPLPELARGMPWQSPFIPEETLSAKEQRELLELNRRIRQLERAKEQGGEASGAGEEPARRRRGETPDMSRETSSQELSEIERLRKKRRTLVGREDVGGHGAVPDPRAQGEKRESDATDRVTLWRHDLTAEAGATYQYRVRVGVLNPLFQRSELTAKQRERYQDRLTLLSPASEWSDSITIRPDRHFFVVGANRRQRQATVEVWRLFGGIWRSREFTVSPGDPVGESVSLSIAGRQASMAMEMDLLAVDLVSGVPAPGTLEGKTVRLIYQRLDRGSMGHRDVALDRDSATRRRLQVEATRYAKDGDGGGESE